MPSHVSVSCLTSTDEKFSTDVVQTVDSTDQMLTITYMNRYQVSVFGHVHHFAGVLIIPIFRVVFICILQDFAKFA